MFALLLLFGCANSYSNQFCADKCEQGGGFLHRSMQAGDSYYCECMYPGAAK